jgi:hypothetical protein
MADVKDNIEFVTDFMNFSKSGVFAQVFVMEALYKYSELVIKSEPWEAHESPINFDRWKGIAEELHDLMDIRYAGLKDTTGD